jgi:primosomal protein N' (replication factor Y)
MARQLAPGHRVLVPLRSRRLTAVVTETGEHLDSGGSVPKAIIELLEPRPLFDSAHLQLIEFLANYYMVRIGEAFRNVLPSLARVESHRMFRIALVPGPLARLAFSSIERDVIDALSHRPMTMRQLLRLGEAGEIRRAIRRLTIDGYISARAATRGRHRTEKPTDEVGASNGNDREPFDPVAFSRTAQGFHQTPELPPRTGPMLELTAEQLAAVLAVTPHIDQRQFEPFLLSGVTGSGKSEVYIRLAGEALNIKRQVLVLVPEIVLADQLVASFRSRFGSLVAVVHSAQNIAERWASWVAALNGDVRIIIGPRSAIFAPINDLGLIVVDEEHDSAYKQEEGIRYNARDLAVALGRFASCPVVLGSATPSAESFANARVSRYRLLRLTRRVHQREFAQVDIIDLRRHLERFQEHAAAPVELETAKRGSDWSGGLQLDSQLSGGGETVEAVDPSPLAQQVLLSPPLLEALRENLDAEGQSLVFLNRRGYHNFLQCHLCGNVITCTNCSVSMTFHLRGRTLRCHYCGATEQAPDKCYECGGFGMEGQGFGTERLVLALRRLLPTARIERMDSDTSSRGGARRAILQAVRCGEIDLLVGTQMITKGLDFHNVTLVAVVLADLSLNLPDFRSAERTFQLLTQAAGRAGRGERPGRVLIQTYAPHHYSVRAARDQDYSRFIRREMELRRELMYPPFARLAMVRIEGAEPTDVSDAATKIAALLTRSAKPESVRVLGPAPAPIERINKRYRWQVLIKARERPELRAALSQIASFQSRKDVRVNIDIDPVNML